MLNASGDGHGDGFAAGNPIDAAELCRPGWTGVSHTDQLHKGSRGPYRIAVGIRVKGVPLDRRATCWKSAPRFGTHQSADLEAAVDQPGYQSTPI